MRLSTALPLAFALLLGLGTWRHLDAAAAASPPAVTAAINAIRAAEPPPVQGSFPTHWINGRDCGTEAPVQVHAYDSDTFIIRQGKCEIFEAPFMFLLFGEDKALLMDTGAKQSTNIAGPVKRLIDRWLASKGKTSIPLIVAHTHGHFDHHQGDSQFQGQHWVQQVVGLSSSEIEQFWGFQNYPVDVPTYDLGGRVIDVLGTPGHHGAHVSLYDRNTNLLLAGDIVYPGHLFVFSAPAWSDFVESLDRLTQWAVANPVSWVLGCHIEIGDTAGSSFAYGTTFHPNEHALEFPPSILAKIYFEALQMAPQPQCQIFDEFVLHPVYLCGIGWNG